MTASALLAAVTERFADAVRGVHAYRGDATAILSGESLLDIARTLKQDDAFRMNFLMDLTAVDFSAFGMNQSPAFFASSGITVSPAAQIPDQESWPGPPTSGTRAPDGASNSAAARFAVVYHLYSLSFKHRLRLVVPVDDVHPEVDSVATVWASADWLEREVWDMFGIRFRGHPNLKRILMYEEFVGHPLRKDYPVNKRQPLIGPVN